MDSSTRNNINLENVNYPEKKFSAHDIVTITGRGETFHIYAEPSWSNKHNEWLYPYDYGLGGTSEGFALERDMKSFEKNENEKD